MPKTGRDSFVLWIILSAEKKLSIFHCLPIHLHLMLWRNPSPFLWIQEVKILLMRHGTDTDTGNFQGLMKEILHPRSHPDLGRKGFLKPQLGSVYQLYTRWIYPRYLVCNRYMINYTPSYNRVFKFVNCILCIIQNFTNFDRNFESAGNKE